jgi:hypothetical protein
MRAKRADFAYFDAAARRIAKPLIITDFGEQILQTRETKAQSVIAWGLRSR